MTNIKLLLAGLLAGAFFIGAASAQTGQLGAGQVWGNPNAAQGVAVPSSISAILDRALGSTRGAILERGVSGWAIVGPGATAGLAWISAGTGADPAYGILGLSGGGCNAALTASNGGILYSTASACGILSGTATARLPLLSGASTTPVWGAYTLPASVTSGGVPYFSSTSAQGSSALLVANQIMLGGGAGLPPATLGSLGSATTVLHGGVGAPTFGAVSLTADVSGQLPIANGGCNGTTAATCLNNITPTPTRAGDLLYWNGSAWVTLAGNNSGTQILQETSSGVPSWAVVSGTGTVTSTVIAASSGISISGTCTITTSGTCTVSIDPTFIQNFIGGLTLSNDGGSPNTVLDIAAGSATDSTNASLIKIGAFTKSTAGAWTSGTGNNGMGNGLTIANATWYHVCLTPNGGTSDAWFDTSVSCANKPAGVSGSLFRRIGSFKTNGSAQIIAFTQVGDEFHWAANSIDLSFTTIASTTANLMVLAGVPTGVQVNALFHAGASLTSNGILFTSPDETDVAVESIGGNANASIASTANNFVAGDFNKRTDTSGRIRWRALAATGSIGLYTFGWIDSRGKS